MKTKFFIVIAFNFFVAVNVFAQESGAEPLHFFAKGKSSLTKTDSLSNGQTYEFVFGAKSGQKVKIKIVSTSPKGKFHYFSLLGDGFDFATEYDTNYDYTFTAPETGDYLLNVNFNPTSESYFGQIFIDFDDYELAQFNHFRRDFLKQFVSDHCRHIVHIADGIVFDNIRADY